MTLSPQTIAAAAVAVRCRLDGLRQQERALRNRALSAGIEPVAANALQETMEAYEKALKELEGGQ